MRNSKVYVEILSKIQNNNVSSNRLFQSLLLGCWLFFFPESPKFLIECGETEEALEILRYMYQQNTGKGRTDYPVSLNPSKDCPLTNY